MTLEQKRRHLDSAISAIARAESLAATGAKLEWEMFQKITAEIQMQTDTDWTKRYYNEEAQNLIAERMKAWNPQLQKEAEAKWAALYRDIEAAAQAGLDPLSPEAQALADRTDKLVQGFTGGHPSIAEGLSKLWADKANWPKQFKQQITDSFAKHGVPAARGPAPTFLSPKAESFFNQVNQARLRKK
jgi:hypothetical protein